MGGRWQVGGGALGAQCGHVGGAQLPHATFEGAGRWEGPHQVSCTVTASSWLRRASTLLAPGCQAAAVRPSACSTTYLYSATQPVDYVDFTQEMERGQKGGGSVGGPQVAPSAQPNKPCPSPWPCPRTCGHLHRDLPLVALCPLQLRRLGDVPVACSGQCVCGSGQGGGRRQRCGSQNLLLYRAGKAQHAPRCYAAAPSRASEQQPQAARTQRHSQRSTGELTTLSPSS